MRTTTFADCLQVALKRSGMTQAELARSAEIDQSSISRYLRGQCEPNLRQFRAIAHALSVHPSFLLGDGRMNQLVAVPVAAGRHLLFHGKRYIGEWRGDSLEWFGSIEVVEEANARELLESAGQSLSNGVHQGSRRGNNNNNNRKRR